MTPIRMPHNAELEQFILGGVMVNAMSGRSRLQDAVVECLPEHFYDPLHQLIWSGLTSMADNGIAFTHEGFRYLLESVRGVDRSGEQDQYIARLLASDPVTDLEYPISNLKDLALQRGVIETAQRAIEQAQIMAPGVTGTALVEHFEKELSDLATRGSIRPRTPTLQEIQRRTDAVLERRRRAKDGIGGVPTGLREVDERLGGLQTSELAILAGRPGMGKTALATTIAVNAAKRGFHVRFISLEMSAYQLYMRLYAMETEISTKYQASPECARDSRACRKLAEAALLINQLPLYIDDTPAQTLASIRAEARRQRRLGLLDLLVIDYLGLIRRRDPSMSPVHAIEEITSGLKALSKELDIPILLLCQLSRGVEGREDRRPGLADLRDSGAIEQDADVVMFVFREEYYLANQKPGPKDYEAWCQKMDAARGVGEVITGKYRQGETGIDRVAFNGPAQLFSNLPAGR